MSVVEEVAELLGAAEFYVDGFDGYEINENILSCYGYRMCRGAKQIVVRLVMPVSGVPDTIGRATAAMQGMPMLTQVSRPKRTTLS